MGKRLLDQERGVGTLHLPVPGQRARVFEPEICRLRATSDRDAPPPEGQGDDGAGLSRPARAGLLSRLGRPHLAGIWEPRICAAGGAGVERMGHGALRGLKRQIFRLEQHYG